MKMVPEGGDWRDLPVEVQKDYMGASFYLGGGKTGMARRLAMDEPSLTLTCAPAQKQTERCHPKETRPLTVREYARIQTFPDEWLFSGTLSDQYKQIGNAVPVNLAFAVGRSLMRLMNDIQAFMPEKTPDCTKAVREVMKSISGNQLFLDFDEFLIDHPDGEATQNVYSASEGRFVWNRKNKSVLVCVVKKDVQKPFMNGDATLYYTGKQFPSTVALNNLYYFMPHIKGKGIRDLYLIKLARVGSKAELVPGADEHDYRLVFELQFVRQLFDDYKPFRLEIKDTYTDTTIGALKHFKERTD